MQRYNDDLSAIDSSIRDTDMAKESATMLALQVIRQASIALLAQASQLPQAALKLLQKG